jgi:hypothetical protein
MVGTVWGLWTGLHQLIRRTREAIFFIELSDMVRELSE